MTAHCDLCLGFAPKIFKRVLMKPIMDGETVLLEAGIRWLCRNCKDAQGFVKKQDLMNQYMKRNKVTA